MAQADNPLVSMIVLSYNQARFVVETLESVKAQTYKPTELVIIDDCSSDGSATVIENWLQKNGIVSTFIRHQKNQGVCKSLNEALAVTSGKYISMVASDDIWVPDKIARQVKIMESQPDEVGVLYSDAFQIDTVGNSLPDMYISAKGSHLTEVPPRRLIGALLVNNFIPGMTTLVRRSCYDVVGLYDEDMPTEDWDMWLRIARHYSFVYSSMPVAKYRIHPDSFSHSDHVSMVTGTIKILAKQLDLGHLDKEQKSSVARDLAVYRKALAALHFDLAAVGRRNGKRAATMKHLAACVRSGWFRLPGRFIDWISLLGYGLLGLRRLRWWRRLNPESTYKARH